MKISLVCVLSLDGKSTRWDELNIYKWTSKEDSEMFFELLKKSEVIIMGAKTFEASKEMILKNVQNQTNSSLRIVITRDKTKYTDLKVDGVLEFYQDNIRSLLKQLENRNLRDLLVVGGSEVNTLFFKEDLVDELLLTIEPLVFGRGKSLVSDNLNLNNKFKLKSIEKLNKQGTILLTYLVDK